MRPHHRFVTRLLASSLLGTALALAAGCGDKGMGVISGKVTVDDIRANEHSAY